MTKEQKIRLGIFLFISFLVLIMILGVFLIPKLREEGNIFFINFKDTSVSGLFVGSLVKYQGVDIGKVTRIKVNPEDLNSILVFTRVRKDFSVKKDMRTTLVYTGITGLRVIELSGGSAESPDLEPKGEIQTARGLGEKAEDIVTNIDDAVKSINALLDPENLGKISLFLENVERSSGVISTVLADRKDSLESSIANIEKASSEFGRFTENLGKITDDLSKLTGRLESHSEEALSNLSKRFSDEEMGKVLTNLELFIETASASLKKIEGVLLYQQEELNRMVVNLSEAMDNLSRFSRELTEDPTVFIRGRRDRRK